MKLLQLSEREFLLLAGQTLKTIKISASPKFLPPNNINALSQRYHYTDAVYINKCIKGRYPDIPTDSDQFVVLTTREGALIFMFRTHVLCEYKLDFVGEITQARFLHDVAVEPGRQFRQYSTNVSQEEQQQRNY